MNGFREECEKPPFFEQFLTKKGRKGIYFKKAIDFGDHEIWYNTLSHWVSQLLTFFSQKMESSVVPLKAKKGWKINFLRATADFYVQEYWDITLNTKLAKIRA